MIPIYAGNGGVNRQAKNLPVGVNGVNRTVKQAWVGVNGGNRKVFSSLFYHVSADASPYLVTLTFGSDQSFTAECVSGSAYQYWYTYIHLDEPIAISSGEQYLKMTSTYTNKVVNDSVIFYIDSILDGASMIKRELRYADMSGTKTIVLTASKNFILKEIRLTFIKPTDAYAGATTFYIAGGNPTIQGTPIFFSN